MRAAGVSWVPRGLTCGRVDAHRGRRGGFRAGGSGRGALRATGAALSPLLVVWPLLWLSRRGKDPQRGGQHHGQLHGQLQGPQPQGAQVLWWGPSGQNRLGWGLQGADVCWGGLGKSLSGHGTVTTLLAWPGGSAGTSLLRAAQQTWPGVSAQSAATSTASAEPAAVCRAVRGLSSSAT